MTLSHRCWPGVLLVCRWIRPLLLRVLAFWISVTVTIPPGVEACLCRRQTRMRGESKAGLVKECRNRRL